MQKPHIQIIVGSIRQGRATAPLARWAEGRLRRSGHWSVELIDLADWCFPQLAVARPPALGGYEDRLQSCWARTVRRADAYLIAAPEYNHGYPGVLKTALDYIYAEWRGKPVSCLAFGNAEGARMVEAIQQVFIELGMIPVAPATHIRMAHAKLREGRFTSDERDDAALDRTGTQLLSWCEQLRVSGDRPEHSPAYAAAARVLVLGLGAEAIQSVVEPLRRAGIEASGMVLPESIDQLPDPMRLDLISFGRGALGPVSERFKDECVDAIPSYALSIRSCRLRFVRSRRRWPNGQGAVRTYSVASCPWLRGKAFPGPSSSLHAAGGDRRGEPLSLLRRRAVRGCLPHPYRCAEVHQEDFFG